MLVNSTGISNLISLIFSLLKRWFSSQFSSITMKVSLIMNRGHD